MLKNMQEPIRQLIESAVEQNNTQDLRSLTELRNRMLETMIQEFDAVMSEERFGGGGPAPGVLSSDWVTVEFVDDNSGRTFRRFVELTYEETDNGFRLIGESMDGKPAEIVFLSDVGLAKIKDLTGHGPQKPRCPGHTH